MTKAELITKIYEKAELPSKAKAEEALNAVIEAVTESLANGNSIALSGFGSFKVVKRAERKGHNPRTGAELTIPACSVVKFTVGKNLKEAVK